MAVLSRSSRASGRPDGHAVGVEVTDRPPTCRCARGVGDRAGVEVGLGDGVGGGAGDLAPGARLVVTGQARVGATVVADRERPVRVTLPVLVSVDV